MRNVDDLIEEALDQEEREILSRIGEEPGFFGMAFGLLSGRLGWVNILLMVVQARLFLAGAYAAWMFFEATDPVSQLRWGLPSAVLLILSTMIKMAHVAADPCRPADARAEAHRASACAREIIGRRLSATIERRGRRAPASFDRIPVCAPRCRKPRWRYPRGGCADLPSIGSISDTTLAWFGRDLGFNRPRRSRAAI